MEGVSPEARESISSAAANSRNGSVLIEGKFQIISNPAAFDGKTEEEIKLMQESGMAALKTAIAVSVGYGISPNDITINFETGSGVVLAQLAQMTKQTMNVVCIFTFPCPRAVSPDNITASVSDITAASFMEQLNNVLMPELAPLAFTATWFMGAQTTSAPTLQNSPDPDDAAYPQPAPLNLHPCKSLEDYMPDAKMHEDGWCVMHAVPENCTEGCEMNHGSCTCGREDSCERAGGVWQYHTCKDEMRMYEYGEHSVLLSAASDNGSCDGLRTSWDQSVSEILEWPARKCCKSWPQSLCEPDASLATPCKDPSDFRAGHVTQSGSTCMNWLKEWWTEYSALKSATNTGTCDGLALSWGEDVADWVRHPARECCKSFPATLCDKHADTVTPCAFPHDFRDDKVISGHCRLHDEPEPGDCAGSGCHEEDGHCHCDGEDSCQSAGGHWHQEDCALLMEHMDRRMLAAFKEASESGSCSDVDYDGDLDFETLWISQTCCDSFPRRACDRTAKKVSYCADEEDFMPENTLHEWCDFHSMPDAASCHEQGCHASAEHCSCDIRSKCEELGGSWRSVTCGEDLQHWDQGQYKALQMALEGNSTCSDVDYHGQSVNDMISWNSQKCCSSYPATACDPTLQKMTPCKDEGDFLPQSVVHSWCHFKQVPEGCNLQAGCHGDEHHCHCETAEGCAALGGAWGETSCEQELLTWELRYHSVIQEAVREGCDELEWHGQPLVESLRWPAEKCCASFPASVCEPAAKKMTPCKDDGDFLPANSLHEWCHFHDNPGVATCTEHGCRLDGSECHCTSRDSCEAVGAKWEVLTCGDGLEHWEPAKHRVLQEAFEKGVCGVDPAYGSLADLIGWEAEKCCQSFPATLCHQDAKEMTPCKSPSDFQPDTVVSSYCDFHDGVMPNETACISHGCSGGDGWCHCENKGSCEALGGYWDMRTCKSELSRWRPEAHKNLQEADAQGTCLDVEVDGMPAEDFVDWLARECCHSFPATVCDKEVTAMTPCLRAEDFVHNKTMWTHCDLHPVPSVKACAAEGCAGDEHWCHCETEASCTALGGRWNAYQCWQDLQWLGTDVHKGISMAIHRGTCEDVEARHQKLEYAVDYVGAACCANQMSVCQELASSGAVESNYDLERANGESAYSEYDESAYNEYSESTYY